MIHMPRFLQQLQLLLLLVLLLLLLLLLQLEQNIPTTFAFSLTAPSSAGATPPPSSSSSNSNRRVAIVTGASRGIGRGIALELGTQGFIVYCLGRTTTTSISSSNTTTGSSRDNATTTSITSTVWNQSLNLTIEAIAEQINNTNGGGMGIAIPCDLSQDGVIEGIIERVSKEQQGRLDVLVCAAYTVPTSSSSSSSDNLRDDFWNQSMDTWDAINGLGLRQVYAACRCAAPHMIQTATKYAESLSSTTTTMTPLICLISSFGGKSYTFNVAYGIGKAAVDRMARDMSYQLAKYGVATASLYPGLVQTEANLQMVKDGTWDSVSGNLDLSQGETPRFSGRAVTALLSLSHKELMKRSGSVQVVAELAKELDFTDTNGLQPPSIRSLQYLLPNFVFPQLEKETGQPVPDWIRTNVPDIRIPWSVFSAFGPPPEMVDNR